jgi:hypothetical protein
MHPQPSTGLGIIVKEELGGVFCTLGYIILQDSLFLGDLANLIIRLFYPSTRARVSRGYRQAPTAMDWPWDYCQGRIGWSILYPRVHNTPGFPIPR